MLPSRPALVSAVVATVAQPIAGALLAGRIRDFRRTNFHGREVSLAGGCAAAAGAVAGLLAGGGGTRALLVPAAAAAAGAYDDLIAPRHEIATDKGLRGHLAAARAGRLSGGVVKVALIGGAGLLAASGPGQARRLLGAGLIAGSANLVNLLDLRPGRAGKVVLGAGSVLGFGPDAAPARAALGAAVATLPGDLGERTMLGDLGANPLGALLGLRLARAGLPVQVVAATVIAALTALSERVSFSQIIDETAALRWVDQFARRPA